MKSFITCFTACLLLTSAAIAQDRQADTVQLFPWTRSVSVGAGIFPISKEKLRLGYHWERAPNRQLIHTLSLINAPFTGFYGDDFGRERYGRLKGAQILNELRFYHSKERSGDSYWYHGMGLAYMYSSHELDKGMECGEWGDCAYFRHYDRAVAHTTTFTGTFGVVITTKGNFNFDIYTGIGLRGTYFPEVRSGGYFGKGFVFAESESFVLQPYFRLGMNTLFGISKRKERPKGLQEP